MAHPGGRPTKYLKKYCNEAAKLCKLGATTEAIADFFNVTSSTIKIWIETYPEFSATLKQGKAEFDNQVEKALFHRAMGYSHPEVDIKVIDGKIVMTDIVKHYPPSEVACIFWLKNRRPDLWRDAYKIDQQINGKIEVSQGSVKDAELELLRRGINVPGLLIADKQSQQ